MSSSPSTLMETCKDMFLTLGYTITPPERSSSRRSLCDGLRGNYSIGGHVGGLFLILFASLLGVVLPLLTKYIKYLRKNPFAFTIGKTAATGVLLSVSSIHLINEGIVALSEPCIPGWLTSYGAYAFLFALIAVLLMQALDLELAEIAEEWMRRKREKEEQAWEATTVHDTDDLEDNRNRPSSTHSHGTGRGCESARMCDECSDEAPLGVSLTSKIPINAPRSPVRQVDAEQAGHSEHNHPGHVRSSVPDDCHGHQHLIVVPPAELGTVRHVIAAICMEFGVALHSVFVGVAVGLTTDQELRPLLVALFFHQLFEGMAMGSRIVDASFHGKLEIGLALIFAFSAPVGMGVAIAVVSVSRDAMSGGNFVTSMGILDAFCGGILLYLAFNLLLLDFPMDVKRYCTYGQPNRTRKKIGLFTALWFGMALMAAVGNWL